MGGKGMVCVTTVAPPAAAAWRVVTVRVVVTTRRTRFTFFTGARVTWRARYCLAGFAL
jgi:hypothetical protein